MFLWKFLIGRKYFLKFLNAKEKKFLQLRALKVLPVYKMYHAIESLWDWIRCLMRTWLCCKKSPIFGTQLQGEEDWDLWCSGTKLVYLQNCDTVVCIRVSLHSGMCVQIWTCKCMFFVWKLSYPHDCLQTSYIPSLDVKTNWQKSSAVY